MRSSGRWHSAVAPDSSRTPHRLPPVAHAGALAAESLVAVLAMLFLAAYAYIAVRRAAYPFDLEWMEGSLVQHVARIRDGLPLYGRPTLAFTPFLYPPLYYYVSAAAARVTGVGFLPLRLVSIASSGVVFWFLFRLAQRETGRVYAGLLAVGLFAATYRLGGAWLDLARNDSLLLALMMGALYLMRWRESTAGWAGAGALLALAALTKQTAVMMAPPLLLYALLVDWRRALILASTFAGLTAIAVAALNSGTHGWFLFYVVRLPGAIQRHAPERPPLWTIPLITALPVAMSLAIATLVAARPWRDRRHAFWPLAALSGVGAALAASLHVGAYDNVWLPAYLSISVLAAMASPIICERVQAGYRPAIRLIVAGLAAFQLAALRYSVAAQIPSAGDVTMARQLSERLADARGESFVPYHAFVPTPAGPVMHAHAWAIHDVLRGGDAAAAAALSGEIHEAFADARFRLVVLDKVEPWMEPELERSYRLAGAAMRPDSLWTRTGYHTHPRWIYVPSDVEGRRSGR